MLAKNLIVVWLFLSVGHFFAYHFAAQSSIIAGARSDFGDVARAIQNLPSEVNNDLKAEKDEASTKEFLLSLPLLALLSESPFSAPLLLLILNSLIVGAF